MAKLFSNLFGGSDKPNTPAPTPAPSVNRDPNSNDERLARIGRASLIATSPIGILGNESTRRKMLSV